MRKSRTAGSSSPRTVRKRVGKRTAKSPARPARQPARPPAQKPPGALARYQEMRDFAATPEPKGRATRPRRRGKLRYVIQKHAATRLHYDFRLEIEGVLKSWAVPKGPSLDPAQKRLAVMTEDHPLEYGRFEGVIPAGHYGGGAVMLWDHGSWLPEGDPVEGVRKGRLSFRLDGEKLRGGFALVRLRDEPAGPKGNWLLIKQDDEFARPLAAGDVLTQEPRSVTTGRDLTEIAAAGAEE